MMMLYETDYVAWADQQAEFLTTKQYDQLDLDNLIKEVRDLAERHRDDIEDHLNAVIANMLKLRFASKYNEQLQRDWAIAARNSRYHIARLIRKMPSLAGHPLKILSRAYQNATIDAHHQLVGHDLTHKSWPASCPWGLDEIMRL